MALPERYTRPAIILHWLIAALMIAGVALMWIVDYVPEDRIRLTYDTHKSIGLTVLGLVIMRVLWRLTHQPPPLPDTYKPWEKRASHWAHIGLYVLIFALPITGWMHDSAWKGAAENPLTIFYTIPWFRIPMIEALDPVAKEYYHGLFGTIHEYFGYVLYALFFLHVGGALKHQFIDKHPELQRMWR